MEDYGTVKLSRRERQIMDIVYQRGQVSVTDVLNDLPDPPSYSTVRALLRILEKKGYLTHKKDGKRYIYSPTQPRHLAGRSALKQIFQTFFDKSIEKTVIALVSEVDLSDAELDRLSQLIEQAKKGEYENESNFDCGNRNRFTNHFCECRYTCRKTQRRPDDGTA